MNTLLGHLWTTYLKSQTTRYNEWMEFHNTDTKKINFGHLKFEVTGSNSEEYGEWVKKTSILLDGYDIGKKGQPVCKKGKFMEMSKLLEAEKWTLDEIRTNYIKATKDNGDIPSSILWWWLRKQRNGNLISNDKE